MKFPDKLYLLCVWGTPAPLLLSGIALTFWMYFFQNISVYYFVITGFLLGIIFDFFFLKKSLGKALDLSLPKLSLFYIFYTIMIYGFFMGMPVPILIMGPFAAYYFGIKSANRVIEDNEKKNLIRQLSWFSTLVMFIICCLTALMGLSQENIGLELKGMLGLNFNVTRIMIWGLILIGGSVLIVAQYFITKWSIIFFLKRAIK
jgi:hypothetical protein